MASDIEFADMMCSRCGGETSQEVHYAGRILTHITCTACGTVVHLQGRELRTLYREDLKQRLQSKPRRLLRRAMKHPLVFLASLPRAIARQPLKLIREYRTVKTEDDA